MTLADIPELVEALRDKEVSIRDVDFLLLEMIADHKVQDIFDALPEELRHRFRDTLCATFATNMSPDSVTLLFSSGRGEHPEKHKIFASARQWLRANKLLPEAD